MELKRTEVLIGARQVPGFEMTGTKEEYDHLFKAFKLLYRNLQFEDDDGLLEFIAGMYRFQKEFEPEELDF